MIFERLVNLASCLCEQIRQDGSPETCFCGVLPGETAIANYAGDCNGLNGMAWVRLVSLSPMSGVGILSETPGNCTTELGAVIELGIIRNIGVGDDFGEPPEASDILGHTQQQVKDAITMHRAIVCCDALPNKDYVLGTYVPTGPLGGLVGGTWTVTVI